MLYIVYLKCVMISHIKKSLNMVFLWPSVYEVAAITSLSLLCEHCGDQNMKAGLLIASKMGTDA